MKGQLAFIRAGRHRTAYRVEEVLSEDAREDGTLVHARVGERVFAAVAAFRVDRARRAAG